MFAVELSMTEDRRQPISLEQLAVGMFVVELDIPWINSPFISHSRRIKSFKDIDALRRSGVKNVVIDLDRGVGPKAQPECLLPTIPCENTERTSTYHREEKSLAGEMGAAKSIKNQVKKLAEQMLGALEAEQPIDVSPIAPLIDDTLASLERNNQALMNLVHVSRKSHKLAEHAFSTFCLALNLGSLLEFDESELAALGMAALLHEAGWVQLPLNLMGKRTSYSENERKLVEQHVEIGKKLLLSSALPKLVMEIIADHHERVDGSGYPLQKREVSRLGQVLGIVDCYDERVHQLADKPGALPRVVLQNLFLDAKNGVFDEAIAARFITMMGVYPVSSAVLFKSGEKGVVMENAHREGKTVVNIYYGADGETLAEPEVAVIPNPDFPEREITRLLNPKCTQDDPYGYLVLRL